jgi:nitric oxide reductase NorE protein
VTDRAVGGRDRATGGPSSDPDADRLLDLLATPWVGPVPPGGHPAARGPRLLRGRVPGEVGIWIFVLGDMLIFGVFFVVYLAYRAAAPELFELSRRTLSSTFGVVNTLLLLTGSLFVVQAVHAMRRRSEAVAARLFLLAMATGIVFIVDKVFEYRDEIAAGHTPMTNEFYTFYFMFTGLHLIHLCIALVFLVIALRVVRRPATTARSARDMRTVESAASFWHLVDLLWIVLFPLLYLVGAR